MTTGEWRGGVSDSGRGSLWMRAGARGPIPSSEAIAQSEWGWGGENEFAKQPKGGRQMWLLGLLLRFGN